MRKSIYFSGAHFHDLQLRFESIQNIEDSKVGYLNGTKAFPTYEEVLQDTTGHAMALKVIFDDSVISVHELVEAYLDCIKPMDNRPNYLRKGIYYDDLLDGVEAEVALVEHLGKDHHIDILKCCNFFPAEISHQHYLSKKN